MAVQAVTVTAIVIVEIAMLVLSVKVVMGDVKGLVMDVILVINVKDVILVILVKDVILVILVKDVILVNLAI